MIETNKRFWDCDCLEKYIHLKSTKYCAVCGATSDESPDSHQSEINESQYFADEQLQLICKAIVNIEVAISKLNVREEEQLYMLKRLITCHISLVSLICDAE